MKKSLLSLCLSFLIVGSSYAQCVSTCSSYAVSAITYTTFTNSGTNPISTFAPNTDDGVTPLIPIGFNFDFYCTTYTDLWICTNGFLQFNNGLPAVSTGFADPTQSFPSLSNPNAMVALNMNDLDPGAGGTITYTTIGTTPNQKFILTYSNVPIFNYPLSLNTGQIILYETTNIIEIYTGNVTNNSTTSGTQGIEDAAGITGTFVTGRNNVIWSASNSAYQFSPFTPAPPTSITGNTTLCQGDMSFYQATFMTGASAYGWSFPVGWTGTSTLSSITASAGVSGNLSVTATYTCGTSAPATIAVNVTPAPIVNIVTVTPVALCSGGTITFTLAGADTYTLNPGAISGVSPLIDIASVSTNYTLSGTNSAGCVSQNAPSFFVTVKETPTISVNSGTICVGQDFTLTPSGAATYVSSSLFLTISSPSVGIHSYSVTGSGTNLCVSAPAISNLTVFALPTLTTVSSRTAMCLKEAITLTVSGASTYTWSTTNQSTNSTITVNPNATTVYSVSGTDSRGCVNTSSIMVTVKACVGIDEISKTSSEFFVYPNPNNGNFQLSLNSTNENANVQVFNAVGQLIYEQKLISESTEIDITKYTSGFYFVKVKNSERQQVLKIVKN